jgi:hypothetical protein
MKKNTTVFLLVLLVGTLFRGVMPAEPDSGLTATKTIQVGLMEFTGDGRIDDRSIRQSMAETLKARGIRSALVTAAQPETGEFSYFIGIEIKRAKKGSAVNLIVTLYSKDGRSIIGQVTRTRGGIPDDSIRPLILEGLRELSSRIK